MSQRQALRSAENGGGLGGRSREVLDALSEGKATPAALASVGIDEVRQAAYSIRTLPAGVYYLDDAGQVFTLTLADDAPLLAAVESAREAAASDRFGSGFLRRGSRINDGERALAEWAAVRRPPI